MDIFVCEIQTVLIHSSLGYIHGNGMIGLNAEKFLAP